jgi:preprotein translocase subunit SecE
LADKKESRGQQNAIVRYFRETAGEMRKVTWPTWPEARNLTGIVLVVLALMAAILGGVDYLAALVLNWLAGV